MGDDRKDAPEPPERPAQLERAAKAKVPANKDTLNIDFNIVFITSYIGRDGQLFKDVELGRFFFSLRKAPLDSTKAGYREYYENLKNKRVDGPL